MSVHLLRNMGRSGSAEGESLTESDEGENRATRGKGEKRRGEGRQKCRKDIDGWKMDVAVRGKGG